MPTIDEVALRVAELEKLVRELMANVRNHEQRIAALEAHYGLDESLARAIDKSEKPPHEEASPTVQLPGTTAEFLEAKPPPPKPVKPPSADDVRAALSAFAAREGAPAAIELLKNFGKASKVSEVSEALRAAVIAAAGS